MKKITAFMAFLIASLVPYFVMAQEAVDQATQNALQAAKTDNSGYFAIAAAIVMSIAALGGTMAQGRAASAALEGIGRNPGAASKVLTPMILGLALIESLVIFSFVISILILGEV